MILSFPIFWKLDWLDISSSIPTQRDWFWLVALATVFTVFPYIAMVTLMRKFSAFTINLSLNMEPIYGVALALFFFGETEYMSNGFYFGSILILASVLLHAYWDRQKKAPKAKPKELI
jgi:drug/metabolite transporter (DMT)-like permease